MLNKKNIKTFEAVPTKKIYKSKIFNIHINIYIYIYLY